jgi:hypothetical protein
MVAETRKSTFVIKTLVQLVINLFISITFVVVHCQFFSVFLLLSVSQSKYSNQHSGLRHCYSVYIQ